MGCCGQAEEGDEDKKARKQNKEIEKQIQKDKQVNLRVKASVAVWQYHDIINSGHPYGTVVQWWYSGTRVCREISSQLSCCYCLRKLFIEKNKMHHFHAMMHPSYQPL